MDKEVTSQLLIQHYACLSAAMLPTMMAMDLPAETVSPINSFHLQIVSVMAVSYHSNSKVTKAACIEMCAKACTCMCLCMCVPIYGGDWSSSESCLPS